MLEAGSRHIYLETGESWETDTLGLKTIDHIDVLEDASITVTCNWMDSTGTKFVDKTIDLPAGRYDMVISDITVVSGKIHLVRA